MPRVPLDNTRRREIILVNAKQLRPKDRKQCLVHGDLYAKHLLVQPDKQGQLKLSGIIDWGDLHLGKLVRRYGLRIFAVCCAAARGVLFGLRTGR